MIRLVHDLLDKQLVAAKDHTPMGMADDLLIELRDGQRPIVKAIETGLPALGWQIHPRIGRSIQAIGRRIGVRRGRVYRIPWRRIKKLGIEIELDLDADRSTATAWERWLRDRVLAHIPGGRR